MGGERDRAPGQRKIARRPGVGHVPPMKIFLLALSVMCCLHGLSLADEIEDAVSNAMKLYKEGRAGEAAAGLDAAAKAIREKQGSAAANSALPDTIGGWKGGKMDNTSLAQIGGGNAVEREYRQGEKKAKISIAANSELLGKAGELLSNPALAGLLGVKTTKIGDKTAVVEAKKGLLQMTVNDRVTVMVQGKKLTETDLVELASGVKLDALK